MVVWDREDYLTEAESQLTDPEVYEELKGDFGSPLIKTIKRYFTSVSARGYISSETLNYFMVNNPKLGRFYLLQLRYTNVFLTFPISPISNCGYYTENISAFIDHHNKSFSKCVKSYIKDTNNFLQKLRELPKLPNDTILCTIDVVGLYPNRREEKTPSTESLAELGNVC